MQIDILDQFILNSASKMSAHVLAMVLNDIIKISLVAQWCVHVQ